MATVQKINNDAESKRYQRNMTNTQIKNSNNIKEGIIVNSFVKDPLLSLDETLDTLLISESEVDLPQKVFEKETKKNNAPLIVAGASVLSMGILGIFTAMIKRSSKKHLDSTEEFLLPGITRNHCINNEIHQSIFSMIQTPNRKTILSAIGIITLSATVFVCKNIIDAYKDIWIKRREADIQKNLQENLIQVEAQSFSGKIQIIRSMLSSNAKVFAQNLKNANSPAFKTKKQNKKAALNKDYLTWFVGGSSILATLLLGLISAKNIRKSDELIKKSAENTRKGLDNIIKSFNEKEKIIPVKDHDGNILKGIDAYKYVIETMLEKLYAKPEDIEDVVSKMNLSKEEKEIFAKELKKSMNRATEKVNGAIGGSGRNKITYFSHVNDYLSFFYDWLMNPKNPQFKNLFLGIAGISALGYCGKSSVEAIKEVQVKKYNAQTELDLQKRLVATELKNFKAKKESAINPLCEEFQIQLKNGKPVEELKIMADNILFEIKNGPPFVYS